MALEAGTHGIVDVSPFERGDPAMKWSCTTCGRVHVQTQSWVLTFRHDDGEEFYFIVCGPCADERRPLRMALDLVRLQASAETPAGLQSHVELVRSLRQQPLGDVVPIRDGDLRRLAVLEGLEVVRYVDYLSSIGVLRREDELATS